jgi:predicted dehydrogenase
MAAVRIAVVGCGAAAARHHLPILARMPGAVVTVLVDPDAQRRAVAARHAPAAALVAHHRGVASRPDVDAVVLCLPTGLHSAAALDALAARKHVYVE